ncbi:hypothetical protein FBU30_003525 [Linnemannia zychae]|nr:hypothetical protein FBU30_003525 [Linnemannia zychae]
MDNGNAATSQTNSTNNTSTLPSISDNSGTNVLAADNMLPIDPQPTTVADAALTPPIAIPGQLASIPVDSIAPLATTAPMTSSFPIGMDNITTHFDPNILVSFTSDVPSTFPTSAPSAVPSMGDPSAPAIPVTTMSSATLLDDKAILTSIPPQPSQPALQEATQLAGSFLSPAQQQSLSTTPSAPIYSTLPSVITNTVSSEQPRLQQQQQELQGQVGALSASAKLLQEQLGTQKTATPSSVEGAKPGQNKQSQTLSSTPQKLVKPSSPPQPQLTSVPTAQQQQESIGGSTSQNLSDLLALATGTTGSAPSPARPIMSSSQQLQHDLQQLQLHREQQAAAEAQAAALATGANAAATAGDAVVPSSNLNTLQNPTIDTQAQALNTLLGKSGTALPGAQTQLSDEMITKALSSLGTPGTITDLTALKDVTADTAHSGTVKTEAGSTDLNVTTKTTPTASNTIVDIAGSSNEANIEPSGTPPQIFKATYSGVPVFEMICKGVAVMRRRSDSYLNATQILKVADFDKPQRTRILEREVQKGEHEKVQGGYGKYQGTWVPYERGVQLCQEYNVLDILQPLLGYQVRASSPPQAPKHVTAATNRPKKPKEPRIPGTSTLRKPKGTRGSKHRAQVSAAGSAHDLSAAIEEGDDNTSTSEIEDQDEEMPSRAGSEASVDETMSIQSGQNRSPTPSPLELRAIEQSSSEVSDGDAYSPGQRRQRSSERSPRSRKKQHSRPGDELFIGYHGGHERQSSSSHHQSGYPSPGGRSRRRDLIDQDIEMKSRDEAHSPRLRHSSPGRRRAGQISSRTKALGEETWQDSQTSKQRASEATQSRYAETLLEYFVTDQTSLPSILTHPPPDLDFDLIIDEEGHTPLHWAVAMARIKIVKLLVQHGADIYRVNNQGQTALMRSVLFANNFDMKTFPSLLEILQKTIFTIDKNDQTVFHHVAATAGMRGKVHASRYYMECLLDKLALHPSELASIINVQDVVGDTALIIAAGIGNKKVVRLLLEAGADPKIRNKSGRNADEYLQDAESQSSGSSSTLLPSLQPPPPVLAHSHQQQLPQSSQGSPYPYHSPRFGGDNNSGIINVNNNSSNSSIAHNQRMSHTVSQQSHHPPGNMPVSASPSTPRAPSHLSPNPHVHSTPTMRSTTPPPRHGGYTPSMDRPAHLSFQEYSSSSSSKSAFQPQSGPALPSIGQFNQPRSGLISESSPARGGSNQGSYIPLDDTRPTELGAPASLSGSGVRASQRMIPAVTELFEHLTQSYEKDLYEKEQDLLDARNLLHSIQSEVQEGHRTMDELRSKTMYLGQAEDQIRTLEDLIRQEIQLRQRLRLEDLVVQEENRLRRERDMEKDRITNPIDSGRVSVMEREAAELRVSLSRLQQSRKEQVEQIVQLKSQQGKRRQEYRRLIALCCNVSIDEVDGLLGPLLNTLGNEDGVA